MSESFRIPADMIDKEMSEKANATVVSIRDLMIVLGATDQQLKDMDERDEILEREPWRKAGLGFQETHRDENGMAFGFMTGEIDWSGTRFEEKA